MTKANALNQFVQKEKGPLIASIQQESQKWGMGDASGLGHPFHFKAKPLDVPDFTREIELPRLLEVFFQSLRTGLMTVLSLGTTLFSVAMGVYYMFLKGQGAAVTSQTMTMRYKFYAVLAIIAIPLITGFTLRWGRKQRDKKAAKEVEVARKQIKQEIGREIQNAYKRCLDAFKKALSKHAYETETRFGEVLGAMSLYKQQQRKAGPVATFGVASPLAGMSLQGADKFIERLEKSLLPALKERITLLSVKVREEPLQIGFDLRMWLCTKDTGEEAVSVLEQDVKTYEFPVGQEIHLYLKSDKTVHLLVLNYDQSGQCQLVFPNSHHPNDRLIGHVPHIIPGNGQRYPFRWRVVAAGENRFRAIATTQASLLPADQNTPAAFHELDDNELRNLLDRLEDELQKIPPEMHRVVEIRYRVTM
jgi:hypothetical protein